MLIGKHIKLEIKLLFFYSSYSELENTLPKCEDFRVFPPRIIRNSGFVKILKSVFQSLIVSCIHLPDQTGDIKNMLVRTG